MNKTLIATAVALTMCLSVPASAATDAECQASWSKMDTKKAGYVMSSDAQQHVDMMTKAGKKMAAPDRISAAEYTDACRADIFKPMN